MEEAPAAPATPADDGAGPGGLPAKPLLLDAAVRGDVDDAAAAALAETSVAAAMLLLAQNLHLHRGEHTQAHGQDLHTHTLTL